MSKTENNSVSQEGENCIENTEENTEEGTEGSTTEGVDNRLTQDQNMSQPSTNIISLQDMKGMLNTADFTSYHSYVSELVFDALGDLFVDNNDRTTGEQLYHYNCRNENTPFAEIKQIIKQKYAISYANLLQSACKDALKELIDKGFTPNPNYKTR